MGTADEPRSRSPPVEGVPRPELRPDPVAIRRDIEAGAAAGRGAKGRARIERVRSARVSGVRRVRLDAGTVVIALEEAVAEEPLTDVVESLAGEGTGLPTRSRPEAVADIRRQAQVHWVRILVVHVCSRGGRS
jgi:hypothetical protein